MAVGSGQALHIVFLFAAALLRLVFAEVAGYPWWTRCLPLHQGCCVFLLVSFYLSSLFSDM